MSKIFDAENSMSEKPISPKSRRLADWLNPTGENKVHSLVDKIYKMKNLEMAMTESSFVTSRACSRQEY